MISGIKNITARRFVSALKKDGFYLDRQRGSHQYYRKGNLMVTVAFHHSGQTYTLKTILSMIEDAGWTEDDLRRLKLIK